jgi:hypothetical protein
VTRYINFLQEASDRISKNAIKPVHAKELKKAVTEIRGKCQKKAIFTISSKGGVKRWAL